MNYFGPTKERVSKHVNKVLLGIAGILFLLPSIFLLPSLANSYKYQQNQLLEKFRNVLADPAAHAHELGQQDSNPESGYLYPLLPDDVLPDFSINFSCNQQEANGKRTIEFYYVNRTDYRINLDRSTLRVGGVDINPYSVSDEAELARISEAGVSIIHTHFNSDTITGNNGPLDYMKPGRIDSAMIIEVPADGTVVWTAGVELSLEQSALKNGRSRIQKTTTASTSNLKDCEVPQVTEDSLVPEQLPRLPDDIELGRYNPRYLGDVRECKIEETIESLKSKSIITPDEEGIYIQNLNNQTLTTERTGKNIKFNRIRNHQGAALAPGEYAVILQSYDEHVRYNKDGSIKQIKDTQENESYGLQFVNSSKEIFKQTNTLWVLPDDMNTMIQLVDDSFEITQEDIDEIELVQTFNADIWENPGESIGSPKTEAPGPTKDELKSNVKPDNSFKTSIRTTCFGLVRLADTETVETEEPVAVDEEPANPVEHEEREDSEKQSPIILTQQDLECLSNTTNQSTASIPFDPSGQGPNPQSIFQTVVSTCIDQAILIEYESELSTISPETLEPFAQFYYNDFNLSVDEVMSIAISLAQTLGVEVVIQESEQPVSPEPINPAEPTSEEESAISTVAATMKKFFTGVDARAETVEVGGLDLYSYCKEIFGQQSELTMIVGPVRYAYDAWRCDGALINYDGVCINQYGIGHRAIITNPSDPYSIICSNAITNETGGLDLYTYCKDFYSSDYQLRGSTAYDWYCDAQRQINFNDVCVRQYGAGAYFSAKNPMDPYSLVCLKETTNPNPDDGGGSEGNPGTNPGEEEVEYVDLPDDFEIYSEEDIVSEDYIVADIPATDIDWWDVVEIHSMLTNTVQNETVAEVLSAVHVRCEFLNIQCATKLAQSIANAATILGYFFLGIFEGLGDFAKSFVDILDLLINKRDEIAGLYNSVMQILSNPQIFILVLMDQEANSYLELNVYEKFRKVGRVLGQFLPEVFILVMTILFSPGIPDEAGVVLKFSHRVARIADTISDPLAVALSGIKTSTRLIGLSMRFGSETITFINKNGRAAFRGEDMLRLAKNLDSSQLDEVVDMVDDVPSRSKIRQFSDQILSCGGQSVSNLGKFELFRNIAFGIQANAQSGKLCLIFYDYTSHWDVHVNQNPLDVQSRAINRGRTISAFNSTDTLAIKNLISDSSNSSEASKARAKLEDLPEGRNVAYSIESPGVGYGYDASGTRINQMDFVRVVLQKKDGNYYIVTAYPQETFLNVY